jgi:hypothetical protein
METASRGLPIRKTAAGHANKITPLNKMLVGVLICTLAFLGAINASKLGLHDSFVDADVAALIIASHQTHVNIGPTAFSNIPGLGFLLLAMTQLSSISPQTLEYMPIGAFFVLLATYTLAKRFIPNAYAVAACLVASIVLVKTFSTYMYSIWQHTFGFMLFFLFIYVFIDLENKRKIETLAAFCIIFIGIHLYSYSAELMAISFFIFANVLLFARPKKYRLNALSITLALIAIWLGFNQVVYNSYVPKFNLYSNQIATSFGDYLSVVLHTAASTPWLYVPPTPPLTFRLLTVGWYAAIFLPLILMVIYTIYTTIRLRSISVVTESTSTIAIALLAMFLVWPVDVIAYALIGGLSSTFSRFFVLVAPVLIPFLLVYLLCKTSIRSHKNHISSIVVAYLVVLLITAALTLPLSIPYSGLVISPERNINLDPSAAWFFNSTHGVNQTLSDINTQGEYSIVGAKQGITFDTTHFYTPELYGSLVDPGNTTGNGGSPSLLKNQYVVINQATYAEKTITAWGDLEPLQPYMGSINSDSRFIRIYDDGNAYILAS